VPQISEDQREGDEGQAQSIQAATNSLLSVGTSRKQAAWVDPDDNQLDISIASDRRLRKLRDSAVEDTISGKEYQSRLRRQ
jgi:U3 small nucleolar RNA-associated protein 18